MKGAVHEVDEAFGYFDSYHSFQFISRIIFTVFDNGADIFVGILIREPVKKMWKIPHLGGGVWTRAFSTFQKKN